MLRPRAGKRVPHPREHRFRRGAPVITGRNTHVRRLALPIFVLVVALATASAACVARCIGVPCDAAVGRAESAKVPPCHKGKPSDAPANGCKQSLLLAAPPDSLTLTKPAITDLVPF